MAKENKEKTVKPKGNPTNLIIIVLLLFILILVAGFVVYSVFFNKASKNNAVNSNNNVMATQEVNNISEYTFDIKDEFIGNLADDNGKKSYIKTKISLGYNTKATAKMTKELTDKTSQTRDVINSVLLTKKATDLDTTGREAVKKEIINKLNTVFTNGQINNVYFYDIVIQ